MPPKKAKKDDEKKKDDKGDKDKKKDKSDPAAALDAIRFFPEQKRLERLEEENIRILFSFKGLHEQLQAQVVDQVCCATSAAYCCGQIPVLKRGFQEDILQHFEREMSAKDLQIQSLLSDIKTQQTVAADAVALSQVRLITESDIGSILADAAQEETTRAKLECNALLAAKDAQVHFPSRSK